MEGSTPCVEGPHHSLCSPSLCSQPDVSNQHTSTRQSHGGHSLPTMVTSQQHDCLLPLAYVFQRLQRSAQEVVCKGDRRVVATSCSASDGVGHGFTARGVPRKRPPLAIMRCE
jgi:hypothetical protein